VLTPVPGGVGPVTTAVLMQHVLAAAARTAERG
jgi:5,10-methylene-tetrahydrofolate dehydrogenase/methenyl tetrahydrofolate cyclohydrolase